MSEGIPGSRARVIAIGAAAVAVLTSLIAVFVVVLRSPSAPDEPSTAGRVAAVELVKLRRDSVEAVTEDGKVIGVKIVDDKIRTALGLEPTDVITNLSGRAIKREFDV